KACAISVWKMNRALVANAEAMRGKHPACHETTHGSQAGSLCHFIPLDALAKRAGGAPQNGRQRGLHGGVYLIEMATISERSFQQIEWATVAGDLRSAPSQPPSRIEDLARNQVAMTASPLHREHSLG